LPGDWGAFSKARLYYRAITGVGYRYNMFAPEISPTKYHVQFIVFNEEGSKTIDFKRIVPQMHRANFEYELGIGGGTFRGISEHLPMLEKLIETKYLSKGVDRLRVQVVEYEFESLYSNKKPLRVERVLWSKDYDG
tara:strand:+ start:247125 stop:247532 length:408 start_codon:yes stop_codon:yes gene_type:complete